MTHRDIALLKLKNYTVGTSIDEDILCGDDAQEKIGEYIRAMEGYVSLPFFCQHTQGREELANR